MKRPSAATLRPNDDTDYLPGALHTSHHAYLDDAGSPYGANNGHMSDSDCLSDSSKKIRKKRNTYQKISDDIRVMLLEAVQNGETLKAAAKRHKINYSSAKSILHTYRKEGRILKKSAQERTAKKKTDTYSDSETPQKPTKASKKENMQPASSGMKASQMMPLSSDKSKQGQANGAGNESTPLGFNDNSSTLKTVKYEYHNGEHSGNTHGKMEGQVPNQEGNLEGVKTRLFENFHMSYYDAPPAGETGGDQHHNQHYQQQQPYQAGEGSEYTSYLFGQRDFDPFSEMMNSMHQHNTGALLYPKGFNMVNPMDDHMDSQNMFRQALRKASFFSMGGNSTGYRKDSMDLF